MNWTELDINFKLYTCKQGSDLHVKTIKKHVSEHADSKNAIFILQILSHFGF